MKIQFLFFWDILKRLKFAFLLLWSDKVLRFSSVFMAFLVVVSFLLFFLFPESLQMAGTKCMQIGNQPPGFEVTMLKVTGNTPRQPGSFLHVPESNDKYVPIVSHNYDGADIVVREFSPSGDSIYESRFNIADVVYPLNLTKEFVQKGGSLVFEKLDGTPAEESISVLHGIIDGQYIIVRKFVLGTDERGRDILGRFLLASRGTLWAALAVTFFSIIAGSIIGFAAGLLKGKFRLFGWWLIRSIQSIPTLLLIIAIMFAVGRGFWHVCLVSGAIFSMHVANNVVSRIATGRARNYAQSAYALGIPQSQVIRKYILPDLIRPVFAYASTIFFTSILVESSLNFLHLGFGGRIPSWGGMIRESFGFIFLPGNAYQTLLPGIAIAVVSAIATLLMLRTHAVLKDDFGLSLV